MSQTIVLIDDDKIIRQGWEDAGVPAKKIVITYGSIEEFLENASLFQKNIKIYIDSELAKAERGEVAAKKLLNLGFLDLNLVKGHGFDREKQIPGFIGEVISKAPPF